MVIRLFCVAGMSTSLLVSKMQEAAKEKGKDADIAAAEMERLVDGIDVALLGPQVGFQLDKAKKVCDPKGVPRGGHPHGRLRYVQRHECPEVRLSAGEKQVRVAV